MGPGVDVSQDAAAFRASVQSFKSQEMNRAVAIALNRTAVGVQTEAIRRIRETYRIGVSELRRGFTIRHAHAGNLRAMVFASGRPLNVSAFAARQTKKGVTVAIKGTRKLIPGAFFMNTGSYEGVFERKYVNGRSGKRVGRFPVRAVTTVSVPGMFRAQIINEHLAGIATDRFRRELAAAVRGIAIKRGTYDAADFPTDGG